MLIVRYVKIFMSCMFMIMSIDCYANEKILLHNVEIRSALSLGYPTSIYFTLENKGDELDYLMSVVLVDYPEIKTTINKSIFEKKIVRIIKIDRLALPAHSNLNSHPLHIYIMAEGLPVYTKSLKLKFIFASGLELLSR